MSHNFCYNKITYYIRNNRLNVDRKFIFFLSFCILSIGPYNDRTLDFSD